MDLRSTPISTLSFDISKSAIITNLRFWRAAHNAASFTRFARSAPENPGSAARDDRKIHVVGDRYFARVHAENFFAALYVGPRHNYAAIEIGPAAASAGSRTSGRFVAAIKITPSFDSNPSISTSNAFSVCSRSS